MCRLACRLNRFNTLQFSDVAHKLLLPLFYFCLQHNAISIGVRIACRIVFPFLVCVKKKLPGCGIVHGNFIESQKVAHINCIKFEFDWTGTLQNFPRFTPHLFPFLFSSFPLQLSLLLFFSSLLFARLLHFSLHSLAFYIYIAVSKVFIRTKL